MFILPLTGDTVETRGGVKHNVLSYAPYKDKPAVYVEGEGTSTESVPFTDITAINGTPVQLTPGKIFTVTSKLDRKFQLPQVNDKVIIDGDKPITAKVKNLKLFERGNLASGLQVQGEDIDTGERVTARLMDVIRIERAGDKAGFSRGPFRSLYKDYLGST